MDTYTVSPKDWRVADFTLPLSPLPGGTLTDYNLVDWFNDPPHPKWYKKNMDKVRSIR